MCGGCCGVSWLCAGCVQGVVVVVVVVVVLVLFFVLARAYSMKLDSKEFHVCVSDASSSRCGGITSFVQFMLLS